MGAECLAALADLQTACRHYPTVQKLFILYKRSCANAVHGRARQIACSAKPSLAAWPTSDGYSAAQSSLGCAWAMEVLYKSLGQIWQRMPHQRSVRRQASRAAAGQPRIPCWAPLPASRLCTASPQLPAALAPLSLPVTYTTPLDIVSLQMYQQSICSGPLERLNATWQGLTEAQSGAHSEMLKSSSILNLCMIISHCMLQLQRHFEVL